MYVQTRPVLDREASDDPLPDFVAELQAAIDTADASLFNNHFAEDVLWGSPFGAVVDGYDTLHAIHADMFGRGSGGGSRYTIEHSRRLGEDTAIAYVRRTSDLTGDDPAPGRPEGFDELALFVLVQRDGAWWLAAGQHVPDRRDVYR